MKDEFNEAFEELKRADHLIYVSLKYTRTVDVIKSIIERLINAFDSALTCVLEKAKGDGTIESYSKSAGIKCTEAKAVFPQNKEFSSAIDFYLMLRKISRADYKKVEEYRRHVAMIVQLESGNMISIDIDRIKEYYDRTETFVKMSMELCGGEYETHTAYDDSYF